MIEIQNLRSGCLTIPDLRIEPGMTAIIGQNGAGKTTLLELIAGITLPDHGRIAINGKEPRTCTIGWVSEFPDRNMLFSRVRDEIASPLMFAHLEGREIEERLLAITGKIGIRDLIYRSGQEISGGEKILIALASALVQKPEILILDETDSHLDGEAIAKIDTIIRESGTAQVLFSTHRKDHAVLADKIVQIHEGRITGQGGPKMLADLTYPDLRPLRGVCSSY